MYAVTIIRIGNDNREFQNTEVNKVLSLKEVEQELIDMGADFDKFNKVIEMNIHSSITVESTIYTGIKRGTRFMYIHRIK